MTLHTFAKCCMQVDLMGFKKGAAASDPTASLIFPKPQTIVTVRNSKSTQQITYIE